MSALMFVSYKRVEGMTFDMDYYEKVHMPACEKHWGPQGLESWTVVKFEKDDPSGLYVQAITRWTSLEAADKCYANEIPEIHGDIANYTDQVPVRWTGTKAFGGSI